MQTSEIIDKVVAAIQQAPEKAQELIADPEGAVHAIVGEAESFDIHPIIQGVLARAAELGLDFSDVDLSQLDLSKLDVSKLDLMAVQDAAKKLNVDISKLDMSKVDLGSAMKGLFGSLGGLFGR